jgi:long-chain fatty acid transport protein
MQTVNITPSVAFRVNHAVTFGAGFQAQWVDVKLYRKALLGTIPGTFPPVPVLGTAKAKADDWSYGWTAGVLLQPNCAWNIGFSYRSNMVANTDGHLKTHTQSPSFAAGQNNKFKAHAKIHFPHTFTLSGSMQVNPCWTLYMDVIRTLWSSTKNITINYKVAGVHQQDKTPQHWRDTWFISGGFNYKASECWSFRAGFGYEKTPTKDSTRVPALPDSNKHWLACGATYTRGKLSATLAYGHEFFKKARINLSDFAQHKGTLKGRVKTHIDLVSLQFNYRF